MFVVLVKLSFTLTVQVEGHHVISNQNRFDVCVCVVQYQFFLFLVDNTRSTHS